MASPKARILCTEDDADTRDLLEIILTKEGYEVVCTDNTEQALALAHAQHFDLFLVDSWLPDESGVDFTKRLREFDIKTPVLFYSGAAYQSDKDNARLAGAQGYLVKPTANEEVITEVARLIADAKIAVPVKVVVPTDG